MEVESKGLNNVVFLLVLLLQILISFDLVLK